jgi:hypothetical protein
MPCKFLVERYRSNSRACSSFLSRAYKWPAAATEAIVAKDKIAMICIMGNLDVGIMLK